VNRLPATVCNVASSNEATDVADASSAALASFAPQGTHVFSTRCLSPFLNQSSVTPSAFPNLEVSFSEEIGVSALIELVSFPSLPDVADVMIKNSSPPLSSRTALDWSEFTRGLFVHMGEDPWRYEQLLDDVVGVASLPGSSRRMVLDACLALQQEVCARFPEVDREMKIDVTPWMPLPDIPDCSVLHSSVDFSWIGLDGNCGFKT
jgi:hypothetical protein